MRWIYVARRAAGIARADFPRAWRGHAKLAGRFPDLARLFQATLYVHVSDAGEAAFDAAAILELADAAAIVPVLAPFGRLSIAEGPAILSWRAA